MSDLQVTALGGSRTVIERKNVETFAVSLRGALLEPGQPGYDEGRFLWNGMMDKRPALLARCEGVADVIAAVISRATTTYSSPCAVADTMWRASVPAMAD